MANALRAGVRSPSDNRTLFEWLSPATPTHSLGLDCTEQHKRHNDAQRYANKPKYDGHDRLLSPHNIWDA